MIFFIVLLFLTLEGVSLISTANIEFQTRDGSNTDNFVVLERPYRDRWYYMERIGRKPSSRIGIEKALKVMV